MVKIQNVSITPSIVSSLLSTTRGYNKVILGKIYCSASYTGYFCRFFFGYYSIISYANIYRYICYS